MAMAMEVRLNMQRCGVWSIGKKGRKTRGRGEVVVSASGLNGGNEEEWGVFGRANKEPLTPISFLERAAKHSAHSTSILYRGHTTTHHYHWALTYQRCLQLASALSLIGISRGHVVSSPSLFLFHFSSISQAITSFNFCSLLIGLIQLFHS